MTKTWQLLPSLLVRKLILCAERREGGRRRKGDSAQRDRLPLIYTSIVANICTNRSISSTVDRSLRLFKWLAGCRYTNRQSHRRKVAILMNNWSKTLKMHIQFAIFMTNVAFADLNLIASVWRGVDCANCSREWLASVWMSHNTIKPYFIRWLENCRHFHSECTSYTRNEAGIADR